MKVVIVIPTYNEADNVERLIPVLSQEFKKIPGNDFYVLFVDGNSPDGTADVVKKLSKKYPFARLLLEKRKAGLGAAYMYGFKHAMKTFKPDVIVEMDADFQHDPKDIHRLIEKIEEGYDCVIGSRYVKGGGIPKKWALYRKFWSIGGNIFTRIALGMFEVNDFTTGFRATRVKGFLDKIDLDSVLSKGYSYKFDTLYRLHKLGAKIVEVPILFGIRDRGISKMEGNNPIDSLRVVLALRISDNKSFFRFVIVGFIGLFVDTGLFNLFRIFIFSAYAALLSGLFGMITTFSLNNYWSFKERKLEGIGKKVASFIFYIVSSTFPIFVRSVLVRYFVLWFGDTFIVSNTAFFIGIAFGLVWNFAVYSKIIWRKK